jgi:hypothetical protein
MVYVTLFAMVNVYYFYISTFRSMSAVLSVTGFSSSLISWFPGKLLKYFLKDFEIVQVATVITGVTFVSTSHMRHFSIIRSLY